MESLLWICLNMLNQKLLTVNHLWLPVFVRRRWRKWSVRSISSVKTNYYTAPSKLTSVIFYGPPGTGKTTLAKVIAHTTSANFTQINATVAGKKDMEQVVQEAQNNLGMYGRKTILFIDEIHRFNKGQQDYLLPFVEDGTIILIGATTENPYFEVNGALLSRSIIFELKALSTENIRTLLLRAVNDCDRGMGNYGAVIDNDALDFLAQIGKAVVLAHEAH